MEDFVSFELAKKLREKGFSERNLKRMLAFYNARNANTASNDNISFVLYYNLTLPYTE